MKKRTGVFVCHCGLNIAGTVDVKKVSDDLAKHENVIHAEDYVYMCSDPGHPGDVYPQRQRLPWSFTDRVRKMRRRL